MRNIIQQDCQLAQSTNYCEWNWLVEATEQRPKRFVRGHKSANLAVIIFTAVFFGCVPVFVDSKLSAQPPDQPASSIQPAAENKSGDDESKLSPEETETFRLLLLELGSPSFETRAEASKKLKSLSTDQIRHLSGIAGKQASAEVVIRILAEVDNRYSSNEDEAVKAASDALESLVTAERLLLADTAESALLEHSAKRIDIAKEALQKCGAIVRDGTMMGNFFPGLPGGRSRSLVIMFTDAWKGGDEGLKIFGRLSALFGTENVQSSGVTVYLIEGNPLTEQQEARLAEQVGHTRLVRRGPVALGIVGDPRIAGGGVLIGDVSPGGTADRAGLSRGDLILAMEAVPKEPAKVDNGTPAEKTALVQKTDTAVPVDAEQKPVIVELDDFTPDDYLKDDKRRLQDFDDLVERLKAYKIGDELTVHVVRGYERYRTNLMFGGRRFNIPDDAPPNTRATLNVELVQVKLKGWEDVQVLQ